MSTRVGLCIALGLMVGCVIPYGPASNQADVELSSQPRAGQWTALDARLVRLLSEESDRDRLDRLRLARKLLAGSKTLPLEAQQEVLNYIEALLIIEERSLPLSVGRELGLEQELYEVEDLGGSSDPDLSPSSVER